MRKIAILICFLICLSGLSAQTQYSNEWDMHAGLGNSTLKYSMNEEAVKSGAGVNFGFGYSRYFSTFFGFSLGLEANTYSSSLGIAAISSDYMIPTPPGLQGEFRLLADYSGFEEKQSATLVQIPVMLDFQFPLGNPAFFHLSAGLKYGIPVSSSFKQSVNSITTTGYSSYTAQTYQNMPGHGFDTYHNVNASGKLDMGSSLIFALETGVKWKISSKNYLYTGIYLDYGTTNVWKESAKELLEFNEVSPSDYKYNSILQTDAAYSPKIKEMKTYSIGVKIRLAFGSGKEHERVKRASSSKPPKVKAKPENTPIAPKSGQGKPKPVLE
jgi:hypothetical protein